MFLPFFSCYDSSSIYGIYLNCSEVTDSRISFLLLSLSIKRFDRSVHKDTRGLNDQDREFFLHYFSSHFYLCVEPFYQDNHCL
jgi:hypothetical protein